MTNRLSIILEGDYAIKPETIDTVSDYQLWEAFGSYEAEVSAWWLVAFAQQRKQGWAPFTLQEIEDYYQERKKRKGKFLFNGLVSVDDKGWIIYRDGRYYFTEGFVLRCRETNPAK